MLQLRGIAIFIKAGDNTVFLKQSPIYSDFFTMYSMANDAQSLSHIFSMRKHVFLIIFLSTLLVGLHSVAYGAPQGFSPSRIQASMLDDKALDKKINQLRKTFVKAERALAKGNDKAFKKYLGQLKSYPLYPYLEYRYLRKYLSQQKETTVLAFIKRSKDTPYAERLRRKWLDLKAQNKQWKALLNAYVPQSSTRRQCDRLTALLATGKKKTAFKEVENLWLSARSQPKACDPVFKAYEKAGKISTATRWERIGLAMGKGRTNLALYLVKPLKKADKTFLEHWIKLYRKPQDILNSPYLKAKKYHAQSLNMAHNIALRWARKKPQQVDKNWRQLSRLVKFNDEQKNAIYRRVGLSLAYKHQDRAWYWLNKVNDDYSDKAVREWRVRSAIRQSDWAAVASSIERLDDNEQKSLRWTYWLAETHDGFGRTQDANALYTQLAGERGYFGFLSADKLDMPYNFEHQPTKVSQAEFHYIEKHPGILRAREFFIQERVINARREWYFTTIKQFEEPERIVAAKIAQSWGWHDRAIITIAKTKERDDIQLRFPIMLKDRVKHYSKLNKIDKAYTYATIRRESAFAVDAHSPVGALGLMQIMPATGKSIAKSLKLPYRSKSQLLDSEFNLKLGTNYLRTRLDKFHQQQALASAAYNAGDHRVKRWLPSLSDMTASTWVESIPFKETREYVAAVLAYTSIYQHRLGDKVTRLQKRMPDVPAKKSKKTKKLKLNPKNNKKVVTLSSG